MVLIEDEINWWYVFIGIGLVLVVGAGIGLCLYRGRRDEAAVPEDGGDEFVFLLRIPSVAYHEEGFPLGIADIHLRPDAAPRATRLTVPRRIAPDRKTPDNYPCVAAVGRRGLLLLYATQGPEHDPPHDDDFAGEPLGAAQLEQKIKSYFMCNVVSRRAYRIPDPPRPIRNHSNAVLVGDFVFELQPTVGADHAALLCYAARRNEWAVEDFDHPALGRSWGSHCAMAYGGKVLWVDLSYGLLVMDLTVWHRRELCFIALPPGCELEPETPALDKERCVGVSAGALRYVQIDRHRGSGDDEDYGVVRTWALDEIVGEWVWQPKSQMSLSSLWDTVEYKETGLRREVPAVAAIHPYIPETVYFLQQSTMIGVDVRAGKLIQCQPFEMLHPPLAFHSSRFIHIWKLPRILLRLGDAGGPPDDIGIP